MRAGILFIFYNFILMNKPEENDLKYWKLGLFYYNPNNPELYVDKRFGIGQTFNFAHKKAYYLLLFLILFPILVVIVPLYLLGYL